MDLEIGKKRGYGREGGEAFSHPAAHGDTRAFRAVWVVMACMTFPMLAFVSGVYRPPLALVVGAYQGRRSQQQPLHSPPPQQQWEEPPVDGGTADTVFYGISDKPRDKYLGGLLAGGFDEDTCQSRYQSTMYRKPSTYKPSPYLVQRLRKYEELHKRCAPFTAGYNKTLPFLDDRPAPEKETECKYILWTPWSGLGNRILSLTSSFLYALLTDRVVLIDRGKDMTSLFCEPFPDTTWLLPPDFPITNYDVYNANHPLSYGNLLRKKNISTDGSGSSGTPPSFVYLNLPHDYNTEDMHFFCEPDQAVLKKVPWLFARTNNYIVPGFFLNREFEPELSRLFPQKEMVFHHLGRYLFHPTNEVWGMVTRYYKSYMAMARERLGIQIRIFNSKDAPFEVVSEQVINCTLQEGLLPKVDANSSAGDTTADQPAKTKSVLLTSLYSGYFDKIKDMYWEHPAVGGVVLSVHQPTHEEWQQTDKESHDLKAWAEMILLSLADVLVTSAQSTFGYTGQGLGGITPWILLKPEGGKMPQPACVRETSIDPCFHSPPWYVCREKRNGDNGKVVPFVTQCTDVHGGIKLVDRTAYSS
ncbi:hypothetical protein Taro_041958 [Colocasia esculenta]|uniref:Fucosyltransferase n=1 Tax=Colocasia esculenta TaxID=4460 RepID=A0A843WYL0_COLES|nr:hypothetical protein [Colocasia esculenta]